MQRIGLIVCLATFVGVLTAPVAGAAPITNGRFGVEGGIATGEGGVGLGWIIGANYKLMPRVGPLHIRGDVTYQSHGSDLSIFGLAGNAVLPLGNLYGLGGIGWYRSDPGDDVLATQLGVGLNRFGGIYLEARRVDIDGFTTIPIVVGIRF
jgi:hypothetical protein